MSTSLLHSLRRLPQQRFYLGRFRAAVDGGRPEAAFEAGERLLDLDPTTAIYEELVRPFDRERSPETERRLYDMLRVVERDGPPAHAPWRTLFRTALLARLGWYEDALRASVELTRLPARYGWMRHPRGMLFLNNLQAHDEARGELEATLQAAPAFWKARGTLAECLLCQGHEQEAFALMAQCVDTLAADGSSEHGEATAWRGELRLWLGQYDAALADCAPGLARGFLYAQIWGGGAHLLLGDHERALGLLDRAVRAAPRDAEAHLWRGEAHERLGRLDLALADYDRAMQLSGTLVWPCVGRALVKARLGDLPAAMADYNALPSRTRGLFEWKTGARVDRDPEAITGVLSSMRDAARGLRRNEQYLEALWCRRDP